MNQIIRISPIKRFFKLLEVDKQDILSVYAYALFNGIITLSLPLGIQAIINLISGGQVSTSWIVLVVFVIAGVTLNGVMQIMQLSITENLQQKIFARSAFEFAYRIPRLKLEAVDKYHVPELVNRFFDTLSLQKGLSKILMDFSSASLQVVFGLLLLSLYHPFFILFSCILIASVYLIFKITAPRGLRTSIMESERKYAVAHWLEELARTLETFQLAGKSQLPLTKTDKVVSDYIVSRKAHFKTLVAQYGYLVGLKVLIAAGLLLIGGLLVINQQMNIGQFVASEIIIILVLASVEKLILSMETIYDVLASIEKIGIVTDIPLIQDSGAKTNLADKQEGLSIGLNNLSYRFDGNSENNLKGINLKINAGEKICLSGDGGAGKSILLQVIAALYDNFSGALTYNNLPLGNWCREDLHSLIGDSLAKEDIFFGSLLENLALGKEDVTLPQVQDAVNVVGLTEFVESLAEGYNTTLLAEGKSLPKNIRLKIMFARCLIGNPKLILLEDNFNQLGEEAKQGLLAHLLSSGATVIAVSNNPQVAKQFDRVLVMENGKLSADDPLEQLEKFNWFKKIFQG